MRKKRVLVACLLLLVWTSLSLLFLLSQPSELSRNADTDLTLKVLNEQLHGLQDDLNEQRDENSKLLASLQKLASDHDGPYRRVPAAGVDPGPAAGVDPGPAAGVDPGPAAGVVSAASAALFGVLVFACDRVTVTRHLDQLLRLRPDGDRFPVVVSQDCGDQATASAIAGYGSQVTHLQHPDLSDITLPAKQKRFAGYYKIARHYRWALDQMFNQLGYNAVLVLEDDLDLSSDIFEYFSAMLPLLQRDPSLWCISAWNDNGKAGLIDVGRPELLYRTDFFPGLGWMLTRELWRELQDKWPVSFWDDWIRKPEQRRGRQCIRPEVSRTRTFGKKGVSNGLFFEKHLKFIHLNEAPVHFSELDLRYLDKDVYRRQFVNAVYSCLSVTVSDLRLDRVQQPGCVRLHYITKDNFKLTAKTFGLMDDFKAGVPRTGYRGVVSFVYRGRRVYLAPPSSWTGYDPSWS